MYGRMYGNVPYIRHHNQPVVSARNTKIAFYADQANYKNAHLMRITKCMLFHAYQRIFNAYQSDNTACLMLIIVEKT